MLMGIDPDNYFPSLVLRGHVVSHHLGLLARLAACGESRRRCVGPGKR